MRDFGHLLPPSIRTPGSLQENHTHSSAKGHDNIGTHAEQAKLNAWDGDSRSGTGLGGGAGARSTGGGTTSGRRSSDSTSACGASLAHERSAGADSGSSRLGGGSTAETTSRGVVLLARSVLVEGEGELLSAVAHAVRTIGAESSVVCDTGARRAGVTANLAEKLVILIGANGALDNARERLVHALAEVLVRRWGKRSSLSSPGRANRRAGLSSGVGRGVGCTVHTSRRGLLDLAGVRSEVGKLADRGRVDDSDET